MATNTDFENPGVVKVNENVSLTSKHDWSFINHTGKTLNVKIEVELKDDEGNHNRASYTKSVSNNTEEKDSVSVILLVNYKQKGSVKISATTKVSGDTIENSNYDTQFVVV